MLKDMNIIITNNTKCSDTGDKKFSYSNRNSNSKNAVPTITITFYHCWILGALTPVCDEQIY